MSPFQQRIFDALKLLHSPDECREIFVATADAAGLGSVESADDLARWATALKSRGGVYQTFAASLLAQAAIHGGTA